MPFANDIVGGTKLLIPAIRSPNYIPGVSGWSINRDGSAEFASGTFRGPVVIIDPGTGIALATIGLNGNGSFQYLYANDLIIGDESLAARLALLGVGIVGQFRTTSALPNSGVSSSYTSTCWTSFYYRTDRQYKVTASTTQWTNGNAINNQDLLARVLVNQPGVTGGAANAVVHQTKQSTSGGESQSLNIEFYLTPGSYTEGAMTVALQLAGNDVNAWTNTVTNSPFQFTVEDVGPATSSVGGSGAPSGLLTWTATYTTTATRSYDEDGSPISSPDRDNFIYQGTFPDRSYGDESFEAIFDGARMRTDLSGATINYARLWLYCTKAEEAAGSLLFGVTTDTSVQATLTDNSAGSYGQDDEWPVPGWRSFDLLTFSGGVSALNRFLSNGGNGIIGKPTLFGFAATGFAGYGYAANKRPYIEVNYVGNPPSTSGGYGVSGYGTGPYGS